MDIFLIIGLVLGAICIMLALILKGASVATSEGHESVDVK